MFERLWVKKTVEEEMAVVTCKNKNLLAVKYRNENVCDFSFN